MNIKVYTRIRPLNLKQKDLSYRRCIETKGPVTRLYDLEDPELYRDFLSDGTFQNYSQSKSPLASQDQVFNQVGLQILQNVENGYDCCLLLYGQTGTGKTFTIMGCELQCEGIIPRTCRQLFNRIQHNQNKNKTYQVTFSMLEIYNERIRDLTKIQFQGENCRVRQNKLKGIYIENLTKKRVYSYQQISAQIKRSHKNQVIWHTNMGCTSSRAHTITTIQFKQIIETEEGNKRQKNSIMHFVDFAGSEKIKRTGGNGVRLRQATYISKSISTFGLVISILADISMSKQKRIVPYRDSVLTRILQNALGGNCKTTMICTISPAPSDYEETLSTLRHGETIRRIQNKLKINQREFIQNSIEVAIKNKQQKKQPINELNLVLQFSVDYNQNQSKKYQQKEKTNI